MIGKIVWLRDKKESKMTNQTIYTVLLTNALWILAMIGTFIKIGKLRDNYENNLKISQAKFEAMRDKYDACFSDKLKLKNELLSYKKEMKDIRTTAGKISKRNINLVRELSAFEKAANKIDKQLKEM